MMSVGGSGRREEVWVEVRNTKHATWRGIVDAVSSEACHTVRGAEIKHQVLKCICHDAALP